MWLLLPPPPPIIQFSFMSSVTRSKGVKTVFRINRLQGCLIIQANQCLISVLVKKKRKISWLPVNISTSLFFIYKMREKLSWMMACVIAEHDWHLTGKDYFELLNPCSQLKSPPRSVMVSTVKYVWISDICLSSGLLDPFDLQNKTFDFGTTL